MFMVWIGIRECQMIIFLEALKILLLSASYLLSLGQKQIGASQANIREKEGCVAK